MPLFFIYTTVMVVLNIQFCLETFLQAMSAVLKCLLLQKSNVIVTWPVRPCYFSMEQNLSLPLGIMKFHNELPWHGFVQSFYCVFPESIKFWNMSISSEKFFQWFLWAKLQISMCSSLGIQRLKIKTNEPTKAWAFLLSSLQENGRECERVRKTSQYSYGLRWWLRW